MNLPRFWKALIFTAVFFICSAHGAFAQLSITPSTWNVVGLDSNRPATDGPNEFPVGVKVCNTSSSALSNLNTAFYWDSTNSLINLNVGGTSQSITQSSIAANTCIDVYFTVVITRTAAAYNTKRTYHIESSATGASTVSTPTPREIFVEKLVSQNRNTVQSIVGPTTVYVGQTYNYTVKGSTAPGGYEQLEAFLNLSNVIFKILSVETTYTAPAGATSDKIYADSCGWDNNPSSPNYRSCTTSGKAGADIVTKYSVLILSAGTTTASTLIYDFSGSSYHYNSDFGVAIGSINITALAGSSISGTVFNDVNGLTDSTVNGTGTNAGGPLYANLLDANNVVVQTILLPSSGAYSFSGLSNGNYTVQVSTNQGIVGSAAPAKSLPSGWVNTGESSGAVDGLADGLLAVAVASANVSNANFGIEQRPVAATNTAASQTNPGGTNSVTVPATTFSATDTASVTSLRITGFPTNATSITVNGTQYTSGTFPSGGVMVPTNSSGNPTQPILVDPFDGAMTVGIPFMAIDNAGVESATAGSARVPFTQAPTAGEITVSGRVSTASGRGISRARVSLTDANGNVRYAATNLLGKYRFSNVPAGENIVVSVKNKRYTFDASSQIFSTNEDRADINFVGRALHSQETKPENAGSAPFDFDGDNRTDVAVYRPSNQTWYVLMSSTGTLRVEQFAADAGALIAPADYDGDGIADLAVYNSKSKIWTILQSSNGETHRFVVGFGESSEARPVAADYDGDGKADIALDFGAGVDLEIRQSSNGEFARRESKSIDRPEIEAAVENGSATTLRGDFDGDGTRDAATFNKGLWTISSSSDSQQNQISFGIDGDIPAPSAFLPKAVKLKRAER